MSREQPEQENQQQQPGQQVTQKPELGTDEQVQWAEQPGPVKRGGAAHTEEPNKLLGVFLTCF